MLNELRALVIESDPAALARIAGLLDHKGFRIAARPSPDDSLDYVARTRPDVVLLGIDYWNQGWDSRILAASPATVVFPVLEATESRSVA
ncbi:MAG: hypothetical protein JO332_11170 [Planctomycetaceae bacterium]|nr:hypothetical protein [Planctomycetaceae bacterium]